MKEKEKEYLKNFKKKMTNEQIWDFFEKLFKSSNKRIEQKFKDLEASIGIYQNKDLKQKMVKEVGETKGDIGFKVMGGPPMLDASRDKNYLLQANIEHFGQPGERKLEFIHELETLMKKHGVFRVAGVLIKKF